MNIYELKKGNYTAKINLSKGANCISLRENRYRAVILREPDYSKPLDNPYLYGMPILFPVNRIFGGRFVFEGREYIFPINEENTGCHLHGIIHEKEFQLNYGNEDHLICSYRADKENEYFGGQHAFELVIQYELTEEGLEQKVTVKNLSATNMPIILGFHTTFQIPFTENQSPKDLRILADVSDLVERSKENFLPTGRVCVPDKITELLQAGKFPPFVEKISRHYKAQGNNRIEIRDIKNGITVYYENCSDYRFRLFYNGDADKYICLEPQNCLVNCMNEQFEKEYAGFQYLMPGKEITYTSKIRLGLTSG